MVKIFTRVLEYASGIAGYECAAMDARMDICAATMSSALEWLDRSFLDDRQPTGVRVHDVRERTLLCGCGQATFCRCFELADGMRLGAGSPSRCARFPRDRKRW